MHAPPLEFAAPWLNAAGALGFAPDERALHGVKLGAFITNPISRTARTPAAARTAQAYPGGLLLHTGLPNPGLTTTLKEHQAHWAASPLPIIPHLLAETPAELREMVERLEALGLCMAVEVGLNDGLDGNAVADFIQAALGELPVIARVPLNDALHLGAAAIHAGASAVSLGPPRGSLSGGDNQVVAGRLYGPALFPTALSVTARLAGQGLPIIAAGGVDSREKGAALLAAGAQAVQVDIALWRNAAFIS